MRRILYTAVSTVAGLVLLLGVKSYGAPAHTGASGTTGTTGSSGTTGTGSSGTTGSTGTDGSSGGSTRPGTSGHGDSQKGTGGSSASGSGSSRSRTVTGQSVDTPYGPVQVKVTLSGVKITDVDAIRLPDGNQRDAEIASYAVPELRAAALSAQSAQIDTVSGATYTSRGYLESLQSALDQAGR